MVGSKTPAVVAVVEDDAGLRKAIGRLLRAARFAPLLFDSAEAYLEASLPSLLCIVMDVRLPGMSGLDLQEKLRAAGNAPPILIITASHQAAVRERAEKNLCSGFFLKPFDGQALIDAITLIASAPAA
jgi:FixJ family two-component response regulator